MTGDLASKGVSGHVTDGRNQRISTCFSKHAKHHALIREPPSSRSPLQPRLEESDVHPATAGDPEVNSSHDHTVSIQVTWL